MPPTQAARSHASGRRVSLPIGSIRATVRPTVLTCAAVDAVPLAASAAGAGNAASTHGMILVRMGDFVLGRLFGAIEVYLLRRPFSKQTRAKGRDERAVSVGSGGEILA
jgi:hypothetical protein